jgi:hypothetical protein
VSFSPDKELKVVVLRKHPWIELLALLAGIAIFALAALE